MAVKLTVAFHAFRAALPAMLVEGGGRIGNIASTQGLGASKRKAAYIAANHGIVGLTKVVALEAAETGVTSNAMYPGWVVTPLVEKQIADRTATNGKSVAKARRKILAEKPQSGRFMTPEQLGELVVLLASPAADQFSVQALAVDDGSTVQ